MGEVCQHKFGVAEAKEGDNISCLIAFSNLVKFGKSTPVIT